MSTLRITNIEAKADASSPTVNEKVKVVSSTGTSLLQVDGATSGVSTVTVGTGVTIQGDTGSVNATGIVTASTFVGDLTGTASNATLATNAQGLSGTPNITVNNITGVAATFTGVLTYEDVTNVDAVGIITAQKDIHVGAGVSVVGIVTATTFVPTVGQSSHKNLVINGDFSVAQYGTSDTTSAQTFTTVDRWSIVWNGLENVLNRYQEQLTSSDAGPWEKGFRNAWKIENGNQTGGADANGYINSYTAIEAQDIASSGWDYTDPNSEITLSFWVKSSVAQTFYGYLYTGDGTPQAYSFSYALAANAWTKVVKTIPGNADITINNDNGVGFAIYLPLFLGTDRTATGNVLNTWDDYSSSSRTPNSNTDWYTTNDATWHLTGMQLEVGSVATPFEHRSFADELRRCQRYYEVVRMSTGTAMFHAAGNSTIGFSSHWWYKVDKRTGTPQISLANGATFKDDGGTTRTLTGMFTSPDHVMFYNANSNGGSFRLFNTNQVISITSSAEL